MASFFRRLANYAIVPIIGLLTLLSILILILSLPPVWDVVYRTAMPESIHKLYAEDAKRISDGFWQPTPYTQINQELNFTKYRGNALGAKEIEHFEDVRAMVRSLRYPAIIGLLFLALWRWLAKRPIQWHFSLLYLVLIGGTLAVWGAIAWRNMFRTLHWWIFQDDSWILPKGCYTLKLFPYAVWQLASIVVLSALTLCIVLLLVAPLYRFLKRKKLRQQNTSEAFD